MNLISDESLKTIKSTGTQPEIPIFRGILTFMGPSSWMRSLMLQLDELESVDPDTGILLSLLSQFIKI